MIEIAETLRIDPRDIEFSFIRASGPGGQNVNKVSSAVQLRYPVDKTHGLTPDIRDRLADLAGRRLTKDGILVIEAKRFRNQDRNREDAVDRLYRLFARAAEPVTPRRRTKTPRRAKKQRLENKRRHAKIKGKRKTVSREDWEKGRE